MSLWIFSIAVFTAGLLIMFMAYGITQSISDVYYLIKSQWGRYAFRVWYALFLLSIAEIAGDEIFYIKIGLWVLFLVPIFARFRPKLSGIAHVVGAIGGIVLINVGALIQFGFSFANVPVVLYALLLFAIRKSWITIPHTTYWVEVAAGVCMYLTLLIWLI